MVLRLIWKKPGPGPAGPGPGKPTSILLAEDDRHFRGLLARALRRTGYDVVDVEDGIALLGKFRQSIEKESWLPRGSGFDLIISDIRMPGRSGLDVLPLIRAWDPMIPVILVTAFGTPATREEAVRVGASTVIDKPFDVDGFLDILRTLLPPKARAGAVEG